MKDFFEFRKMITPFIVQISFWIGIVTTEIVGICVIVSGVVTLSQPAASVTIGGMPGQISFIRPQPPGPFGSLLGEGSGWLAIGGGLLYMVLGPILVRVYCELLILAFRIYDTLVEIRDQGAAKLRAGGNSPGQG